MRSAAVQSFADRFIQVRVGLLVAALMFVLPAVACAGQEFTGRVLAVEDGDTLRVQRGRGDVRVRIFGIDAPEAAQAWGPEAREAARRLLDGRTVVVSMKDIDQYGRLVAALRVDEVDVGPALIRAGAAWNYAQFSQDEHYATLEAEARAARRGLWGRDDPTPPWLFRAAARAGGPGPAAARGGAGAGVLHGNSSSRVFHAPGCQHYNCTNCTVVFESAAAARQAGFRPHTACVR